MMLSKWLFYIQKIIDSSIPLGFALAQANFALKLVELPPSLVEVIHDPLTTWLWALFSFLSYIMIIVGVWLKPIDYDRVKGKVNIYIWFEFPGLISASIFTAIYPLALWVNIGLFSSGFAVICFVLTISIYFLLRFIRQILILKLAKQNVSNSIAPKD